MQLACLYILPSARLCNATDPPPHYMGMDMVWPHFDRRFGSRIDYICPPRRVVSSLGNATGAKTRPHNKRHFIMIIYTREL